MPEIEDIEAGAYLMNLVYGGKGYFFIEGHWYARHGHSEAEAVWWERTHDTIEDLTKNLNLEDTMFDTHDLRAGLLADLQALRARKITPDTARARAAIVLIILETIRLEMKATYYQNRQPLRLT